jgi:hypothetical protein
VATSADVVGARTGQTVLGALTAHAVHVVKILGAFGQAGAVIKKRELLVGVARRAFGRLASGAGSARPVAAGADSQASLHLIDEVAGLVECVDVERVGWLCKERVDEACNFKI